MSVFLADWSGNYGKENEDVVQRDPVFEWSVVIFYALASISSIESGI